MVQLWAAYTAHYQTKNIFSSPELEEPFRVGTNPRAVRKTQLAFKNVLVWFPLPLWLAFTPFDNNYAFLPRINRGQTRWFLLGVAGRGASSHHWVLVLIVSRKEKQTEK